MEAVEESASTRQNDVLIQVDSVIDGAALHRVIHNLTQWLSPSVANEFRMEEHLGSKETFVADIDLDLPSSHGLVNELLELCRLNLSACIVGVVSLLVIFLVFFLYVSAHVAILFLDFDGDFISIFCLEIFTPVLDVLTNEFGNVTAC